MNYKVTKQYLNSAETIDTTFKSLDQARDYSDQKAKEQGNLNVKVLFRVYEFDDVKYSVHSKDIIQTSATQTSSDSSSHQSSTVGFRPTPLEVRPRPKNSLPHYLIDAEDQK